MLGEYLAKSQKYKDVQNPVPISRNSKSIRESIGVRSAKHKGWPQLRADSCGYDKQRLRCGKTCGSMEKEAMEDVFEVQ